MAVSHAAGGRSGRGSGADGPGPRRVGPPGADPRPVVALARVRLVSAGPPADLRHRDEWYHEIRKASKRLRYAAESVEPAFGADAVTMAEAAEDLQEVLGEHQDSVVARNALRNLGARIHLDGDNAFTIGRLHARRADQGRRCARRIRAGVGGAVEKKVMRWLRA